MTIRVENTTIRADRITKGMSRYRNQTVIAWGEERFTTFDTYIRPEYKVTGKERVMMITKGVEFRPDLVSFDVYGFVDVWWKILEFNGMKDIWDFKAGVTIWLPDNSLT
jgi:hypothetical protein